MATAIRDVWVNATAATSLNITVNTAGILSSSGVQANDYLIYAVVSDSQFSSSTFPSGFGTETAQANSNDGQRLSCAQKLATGSEVTLTCTTASDQIIGMVIAVSGADTSTPLDVSILVSNDNTGSASPKLITSASFTPVTNGAMLLAITGTDDGAAAATVTNSTITGTTGSWTNPAGAQLNDGGFRNIGLGYATQTTAGAVTIRSSSSFSGGGNAGITQFLIAVRPAAGGGGGGAALDDSGVFPGFEAQSNPLVISMW